MKTNLAAVLITVVLTGGCEQKTDPTYFAVKLEYIPSSDSPAVSPYHSTKACVQLHRDNSNPEEGFGKPWAANPPDNTWTRKIFSARLRNGQLLDAHGDRWPATPCSACITP